MTAASVCEFCGRGVHTRLCNCNPIASAAQGHGETDACGCASGGRHACGLPEVAIGPTLGALSAASPPPGEAFTRTLKPLVGKRVESVRVDDLGVVYITAAGFGGRIVVKIGEPRRV